MSDVARIRHGRGHARGIKEWGTGVKVEVQFDANFQPVGDRAASLKGQLGKIVRNGRKVPLTCINWSLVPKDVKESIWQEVKDNLIFAPEGFKPVCLDSCNKMWRDHKSKIKAKFFVPFKTTMNISSRVPPNILPKQWRELVEYWGRKDVEEIAIRNSKNRKSHGPTHTTGRTHFSQIRNEMEKSGENTDKMSVFIKTRKSDDPDVAELIAQFNERLSKVPELEQTTAVRDQIFHEVVGKDGHGYCRTYGSTVPRSVVYKQDIGTFNAFDPSTIADITRKVREAVEKQFRLEMDELRARITMLESQGGSADGSIQVSDASSGYRLLSDPMARGR